MKGSVQLLPKTPAMAVLIASDGICPMIRNTLPITVKGRMASMPSLSAIRPFILTKRIIGSIIFDVSNFLAMAISSLFLST